MIRLTEKDVNFASNSVVDDVGKVFFYNNRVFRTIERESHARFYKDLINSHWINEVFNVGLVKTWIPDDVHFDNIHTIIEHERIPYETHPAESTSYMHWQAAKVLVNTCLMLSQNGFLLKDAHPWNIMFHYGKPKFIDFTSIIKENKITLAWHREFMRHFGIAVWLASKKKLYPLAKASRKEHKSGLGNSLYEFKILRKILLRSLDRVKGNLTAPELYFKKLDKWLDRHKPKVPVKQYWSNYQQSHEAEDPLKPLTGKQKFVFEVLTSQHPKTVLDCAANRGYYSEMAARTGSAVVSFDYEEFVVDHCRDLAENQTLDITPVLMDFIYPTPNYGMALRGADSFARFKTDIVLALGLIHHLCINQDLPVKLFCEMLLKYANKGIVLEFVDKNDKHVKSWNKKISADYSLNSVTAYLEQKFPNSKKIKIDQSGVLREIVFFYRGTNEL